MCLCMGRGRQQVQAGGAPHALRRMAAEGPAASRPLPLTSCRAHKRRTAAACDGLVVGWVAAGAPGLGGGRSRAAPPRLSTYSPATPWPQLALTEQAASEAGWPPLCISPSWGPSVPPPNGVPGGCWASGGTAWSASKPAWAHAGVDPSPNFPPAAPLETRQTALIKPQAPLPQ